METLHNSKIKPLLIIVGGFLYGLGLNTFIIPQNLYSGGLMGVTQLFEYFLRNVAGNNGGNIYGIIYLAINLPLLLFAGKLMGKKFFIFTVLGTASESFFLNVLPIASISGMDTLSSLLIGGIVSGAGNGLVLLAGGSGGGTDVIGVLVSVKHKNFSVGKFSICFNAVLYTILLFLFDIKTVIYSIIFMFFSSMVMDKVHFQNINVRLMIFTKKEGIDKAITEKTGRGVTEWVGIGAYSGQDTRVLVSCISKYEMSEFIDIVKEIDNTAFIIIDEGVRIEGNFEKRMQ